MSFDRDDCSSGGCDREATTIVTFLDARKLPYCPECARKIGGKQDPVLSREGNP